jgi:flagellar biosynthetic protein FliQ
MKAGAPATARVRRVGRRRSADGLHLALITASPRVNHVAANSSPPAKSGAKDGPVMLEPGALIDIAREAFWVTLLVAGPAMLAGLLVGLVIAVLQALTQVQELTLVFVPRIVVMFVVIALSLPFMGAALGDFSLKLYALIASGGAAAGPP